MLGHQTFKLILRTAGPELVAWSIIHCVIYTTTPKRGINHTFLCSRIGIPTCSNKVTLSTSVECQSLGSREKAHLRDDTGMAKNEESKEINCISHQKGIEVTSLANSPGYKQWKTLLSPYYQDPASLLAAFRWSLVEGKRWCLGKDIWAYSCGRLNVQSIFNN